MKVPAGVWQANTLSSATVCLTFWSRMVDLLDEVNATRPTAGIISYADDFVGYTKEDANEVWKKVGEALAEMELKTNQAKSNYART